eukprot:m.652 g.652  ORF g.652 m.652 type:complete len:97 (-) comp148_c0_seq2:185-475(-)
MSLQTYEWVSAALADGRDFICGNTFTTADLTFAALAGPVTALPCMAPLLPPMPAMPPAIRALAAELASTPAGKHVARMYAKHRPVAADGSIILHMA